MTGLERDDLQPAGNAAAQEGLSEQSDPMTEALWWLVPGGDLMRRGLAAAADAFRDHEAGAWWAAYAGAAETARQEMVRTAWQQGLLRSRIGALDEEEQVDPALYREELGEVLDYLQQLEMMRAAGQTWEEMASAQGAHMVQEARRRIQEQDPNAPPPSDAELQQAHEEAVGDQDYLAEEDTSWWDGLTPGEQQAWITRGEEAVADFVAYAAREHAELDVQASEIGVDIPGNSNSVAYVDGSGKCWIGKSTIVAIERNPAYATSTVMHELRGHPEFDTGFSLSMELYDAAAPSLPGYQRPAEGSDARYEEWLRYEYFESEIGALMREEAFWVDSQDLDGDGTIEADEHNTLGSPQALLDDLLTNLAGQFATELQGPFVIGLARRFEADPRVTAQASAMFAEACQRLLGVAV